MSLVPCIPWRGRVLCEGTNVHCHPSRSSLINKCAICCTNLPAGARWLRVSAAAVRFLIFQALASLYHSLRSCQAAPDLFASFSSRARYIWHALELGPEMEVAAHVFLSWKCFRNNVDSLGRFFMLLFFSDSVISISQNKHGFLSATKNSVSPFSLYLRSNLNTKRHRQFQNSHFKVKARMRPTLWRGQIKEQIFWIGSQSERYLGHARYPLAHSHERRVRRRPGQRQNALKLKGGCRSKLLMPCRCQAF
jgi:hypothetical protein